MLPYETTIQTEIEIGGARSAMCTDVEHKRGRLESKQKAELWSAKMRQNCARKKQPRTITATPHSEDLNQQKWNQAEQLQSE
jgi:hypothetical protein